MVGKANFFRTSFTFDGSPTNLLHMLQFAVLSALKELKVDNSVPQTGRGRHCYQFMTCTCAHQLFFLHLLQRSFCFNSHLKADIGITGHMLEFEI